MPAIASHLTPGVAADVLGLPSAQRYVLVLVDGLGWDNLYDATSLAPTLRAMAASPLTVGMPSTTATSLTSLTTGVDAARHGMVGYSFRSRPGVILHTMAWDDPQANPEIVQPVPTWFQRLNNDVPSAVVVPSIFANSGMTRAFLRGADFIAVPKEDDWATRVQQVADVMTTHKLAYVYERSLDHVGHLKGWRSPMWAKKLASVDSFVASLRTNLPAGTALLVTGDHGMVDVPKTHRQFVEHEPDLAQGVDLVGGEARLRHLYTDDPVGVARRWQRWLGSRAEVRVRADAMEWFGKDASRTVADRIGDVVAAILDDWAVLTLQRPGEANLIGMHGSLTPSERRVPLLRELI